MNYDEAAYEPDRRIKDVYERDWEAKRIEELGLPPYARIGSLAKGREEPVQIPYNRWQTRTLNFHKFTFVTPLAGESLSPTGRNLYHVPHLPEAKQHRHRIVSVTAQLSSVLSVVSEKTTHPLSALLARTKERKDPVRWQAAILPSIATAAAVGLIVYAAAFEAPTSKEHLRPLSPNNPTVTNSPYSPPLILDSNSPFPLEKLLLEKPIYNGNSTIDPAISSPGSPTGGTGSLSQSGSSGPAGGSSSSVSIPSTSQTVPSTGYGSGGGSPVPSTSSSLPTSSSTSSGGGVSTPTTSSVSGSATTSPSSSGSSLLPGVTVQTQTPLTGKSSLTL